MTEQTPPVLADRPPYFVAGLVALGALLLYVATLAPTTQFWDSSEYLAAARALGTPHPPGTPLFIILGHAWGLLPLGAGYARRITLFAAVTSAAAAGLWFLIGERWLRPIVPPPARWPRRLAAAAGALIAATTFTVWNQSVVNEKVYTVSVLSIALVLWLVVRWADQTPPPETRRDHHLVLIVYLLALTATNHLMGVLVAPAVLVYVLATDPRALRRPRFLVAAALVAAVGTSVYLFLPIRAHFDPYLNEGAPTTWRALKAVLTREQFGKPSVFDNPMYLPGPDNPGHSLVLYGQQLLNYVQYFTWQFGRDWWAGVQRALAVAFAALGLLGARRHWRAERRAALAMTTLLRTLRLPRGRDHGARLRPRRAAIGGPLRARRDGGRQRHVPAVVRAGGRGRTPGRERPRALAREHRLVPAPAAAPAARDVRFARRARVVSDAPLAAPADAVDGPLLPGGPGRIAPGLRGAVAAGDRATRTDRRRARSPHGGAALPHALRSRGARDRQGSAGQAADLLLDLDGELRRPPRPVALPRGWRAGAPRGGPAGRPGRQL